MLAELTKPSRAACRSSQRLSSSLLYSTCILSSSSLHAGLLLSSSIFSLFLDKTNKTLYIRVFSCFYLKGTVCCHQDKKR